MYGFKGTDKDMKCRDFQYTLKQKYVHAGEIKPCESGFHLCKKLEDVFTYYSIHRDNKYFIVEYGENYIEGEDKIVSDTITLLEEITPEFVINNINSYNLSKNSKALLYWSSRNGYLDVVKYLASLEIDIKIYYDYVVGWASHYGHLEVVKYLTSLGADIKTLDNYAIRRASEFGHLEVVKYLVSLGADITATSNYAIRWASENGYLEVVEYLVSQGADVKAIDNY